MFTKDEVESLNAFQESGVWHPFTCGNDSATLIATEEGWRCPDCAYTQDWAHQWMRDWSWKLVKEAQSAD